MKDSAPAPGRPMDAKNKRVLFINPAKPDNFGIGRIHMGFSILGEILASRGHRVKILDYAFLRDLKSAIKVPSVEEAIDEFAPDIVGISVFTYLYDECRDLIEEVSRRRDLIIMLGGPHFSIFPEDFSGDGRVSYVVKGEAEPVILELVEKARREPRPVRVDSPPPPPEMIPALNLDIVHGNQCLRHYQIQLSRGCPYNCSFCNLHLVAGNRIRARDPGLCLDQIIRAKKRFPALRQVIITDDCPTFDAERFKRFLRMFREAGTGCTLGIDNVRANLVDEEMVRLYKAAGGQNICLGVESGHPEVFRLTHKGESLEAIAAAAGLVHKYDLKLGLCFVIGLPEDTPERHLHSIRLAKALRPDYVFWNMCIPWPGTEVSRWYEAQGEVGDLRNFSTLIDPRLNFRNPVCRSRIFPEEELIKAWVMANLETHNYFQSLRNLPKIIRLTRKYGIYKSLLVYSGKYLLPNLARRFLTALGIRKTMPENLSAA